MLTRAVNTSLGGRKAQQSDGRGHRTQEPVPLKLPFASLLLLQVD